MALVYTFGHVTNDVVPQKSQKDTPYVCFYMKEHLGNGQTQTFQVWAWGELVSYITHIGIRKGSMIWISGTLELVDCTTNQGKNRTKRMKVYLSACGHVLGKSVKQPNEAGNNKASENPFPAPVEELDGDRMPLPE